MVIFVNGSFGVGKTSVARLLVERLPRSALFDPEPLGIVLMRITAPWPSSAPIDDFQDLRVWRSTSIRLIRALRRLRETIVVPMAFSNVDYLDEFLTSLRQRDRETFHFCLTAPVDTIRARLAAREPRRGPTAWMLRRAAECCAAHQRPEFAEHIATQDRSPQVIADEILGRIAVRSQGAPS